MYKAILHATMMIFALLFFSACDQKQSHKSEVPAPVEAKDTPSDTSAGKKRTPQEMCEEMKVPHKVSVDSVIAYLYRFWNGQDCRECVSLGENYGHGSYFNFNHSFAEMIAPPYEGISIFPSLDKKIIGNNPRELYFAMKLDTVCPGYSDPSGMIQPDDQFQKSNVKFPAIPSNMRTAAGIKQWLEQRDLSSFLNNTADSVDASTVNTDNFRYKSLFTSRSDVKYGFGFIRKEWIDSLFIQEELNRENKVKVAGIASFLGYQGRNDEEMVRIIMMPVDTSGKILTQKGTYCLERSWPPIDPKKK